MTATYLTSERLAVEIHPNRAALGRAAAVEAASYLRGVIARQGSARVIFACAPSQNEFLAGLRAASLDGLTAFDWRKVTAFHMDEYVGIAADAAPSFRRYLQEHLLAGLPIGAFHPIAGEDPRPEAVCVRYSALLAAAPIDLVCLGIGENGHIAFNDPPVADFADPALIKQVALDDACRTQQVADGCFPDFDAVPRHALSLTIPVFRRARRLSVHVPGVRKAEAARATLRDPITTACPATILRTHPSATLYLDPDSASRL